MTINQNVFFRRLNDGREYLMLRVKGELRPLFLRQDIVQKLMEIWHRENEELEDEVRQNPVIQLLCRCKIICDEEDKRDVILMENYNFSREEMKLETMSQLTRTPLTAKLELTYRCNFRCQYCYIEGSEKTILMFEQIAVMVDKLKKGGVLYIYLTGGEPFLHPDILDIIEYCCNEGIETIVQTNGFLVTENIARKLSKYINLAIEISFHSSIPDEFDSFTGVEGSFLRVMHTVDLLKQYHIRYHMKMTISTVNQDNLEQHIQFLERYEMPYKLFYQILPNVAENKDTSCFIADKNAVGWMIENQYSLFEKRGCTALKTKLWVAPNGDVYPCEMLRRKIGNLADSTFNEVWYGSEVVKLLQSDVFDEPEQCRKCNDKDYCNMCPAYAKFGVWSNGMHAFCQWAELVKEYQERIQP